MGIEGFWLCRIPMKACYDLLFCSKKLHKDAIQWSEKDFQSKGQHVPIVMILCESRNSMKRKGLSTVIWVLCLKSRSNCSCLNDIFWKLQFNENEKNFQLSFWFCFHTFSESRNSMKMKKTFNCKFDFVFTAQPSLTLLVSFFESRNSIKWKGLLAVI